jgi:hypothetical protein
MGDFSSTNGIRGNSANAKLNSKSSTTPIAGTKKVDDHHHHLEMSGVPRTEGLYRSSTASAAGQAMVSRPGSAH